MKREILILVAEDDYLISEEIVRSLDSLGYGNIRKAANGREAVDTACTIRPDVVVMDVQMPELDGIAAAARIQECCPTPIVILTAYESSDLLRKASAAGVSSYLLKPPQPEEMERAITIALARHSDLMEIRHFHKELAQVNEELQRALAEVKQLRGILPICAYCKKIRKDDGSWEQIEVYVREHTDAQFSHGMCGECKIKWYEELEDLRRKQGR